MKADNINNDDGITQIRILLPLTKRVGMVGLVGNAYGISNKD